MPKAIINHDNANLIELDKITISDRVRKESPEVRKHIESLAGSIRDHGLVCPIVLDEDDSLIAGWCRFQAHKLLGSPTIAFVRRSALSQSEKIMLEIEENRSRKAMQWQEIVLGIYAAHSLLTKKASAKQERWSQTATGELIGVSQASVSDALLVAKHLANNDNELLEAKTLEAAKIILTKRKQNEVAKRLATISGAPQQLVVADTTKLKPRPQPVGIISINLDQSTPAEPSKKAEPTEISVIDLSKMIYCADNRTWFDTIPDSTVNIVFTDIPYGIEMSDLEGIQNLDLTKDQHEVDENISLMADFLKNAYRVLQNDGWCLFYYALQHHEKLTNWGEAAGFKVQPWPILWKKTSQVKNNAPQTRTSKDYEPIMLMRKGRATLLKPFPTSIIEADHSAEKKTQMHPFAKPWEVSNALLSTLSKPGDVGLDCYAGGGSLVRHMISKGLKVLACEKMPDHFYNLLETTKNTYRNLLGPKTQFINPELPEPEDGIKY
jgi:ParB-like chromosome segregation protein Spo0J/DNA modification methylase